METRFSIKIFLIPAILFAVFFAFGNEARAATTYYVSPTGSANCASTCLSGAPCSLATVLTCSVVGDNNVILKDGTYTGTSLSVPWSGTEGHPITIKAENDGQVIIDGQGTKIPCNLSGSDASNHRSYIVFEGIVCKNSSAEVVRIHHADNINIKRVSGYNANQNDNVHVFSVAYSDHVLLEDCAATGTGRKMYQLFASDYVSARRCWGKWSYSSNPKGPVVFSVYGTNHSIIENCILTKNSGVSDTPTGITITQNPGNADASYNSFYGNVLYGLNTWGILITAETKLIQGNSFTNNVILGPLGIFQRGDGNLTVNKFTVSGATTSYSLQESTAYAKDADYSIKGDVRNSAFHTGNTGFSIVNSSYVSSFTHTYNNLYNITNCYSGTTAGTGEIYVNPAYNTATYGNGAYLMIPSALKGKGENGADIGAEVLYRYQDGILTNQPLWPWPMEDRIKNETGYSVTYESGGGLWKTLDGVYTQSDTTPPSAPSGLQVN